MSRLIGNAAADNAVAQQASALQDCDVLIVGSGIMGTAIARLLRENDADTSIVMIDGGPVIGSLPGQHLHDTPEEEIRKRFNQRSAAGNQALYVGASRSADLGSGLTRAEPGMHSLSAFGAEAGEMPGSSVAWNVGGMGAHWAAATPWPFGDEIIDFIPADEWQADLETSQRLLKVHPSPYGATPIGQLVHDALNEVFGDVSAEGRQVQPMPMAMTVGESGRLFRTGPSTIFPPIALGGDEKFELRANTLAVRINYEGSRVSGVTARDTVNDTFSIISAKITVICGDAMRTPQLLWASGIRPPALGRFLNEHAFLSGRVTVAPERLGVEKFQIPEARDGEWSTSASWLPHSGADQPFHGQIMQSPITDPATGKPDRYDVALALYIPTEVRAENRLEFSDAAMDEVGLPRITVRFSYSPADLERIEFARRSQIGAGERLGEFLPERDSRLLPPGSSLHYTGTVRMGPVDDGTSVCDPDARVWNFENLFVAGNGVVPTPLTCNSTLTGTITAVRAARAIVGQLTALQDRHSLSASASVRAYSASEKP